MIKTVPTLYTWITIFSRYIIIPLNPRKKLSYKVELHSLNQLRESPVPKGHCRSCLALVLYDKDQSTLNLPWLSCNWRKIYSLIAATAYGSPSVHRYAVSMHTVPSRGVSLLFCNRLLWLLQGYLKPPEGKRISWVQWKFLQMGQRVVLLKARKQVHTMSFLSGRMVSIGSQTRAAPLLIKSVSRFHHFLFINSRLHFPSLWSTLLRLSHCLQKEGCWKKRPEQDPAFPTSPKLAFLLERNQTSIFHFLGKINVIQA